MTHQSDFHPVLLIEGTPGQLNELARRIRLQGAEPQIAGSVDEAVALVPQAEQESVAVVIDASFASRGLKKELPKLARAAEGTEFFFLATGDPATAGDRRKLRQAGVHFAIWNPFDDATLRFQLNRAWNQNRDDHKRQSPRIPTFLHAQVGGSQRPKDGIVYSLSLEGAFIETARASMAGAAVDIAIRLPECTVETTSRVIFANVPGNLQRPNLPLGMAVRFEKLDAATAKQLKSFIKKRLLRLEV